MSLNLPRSVKESVANCRKSVQECLGEKKSRMIVEFPTGTDFQLEAKSKKKGKLSALEMSNDTAAPSTTLTFHKSNRELARLFVEVRRRAMRDAWMLGC